MQTKKMSLANIKGKLSRAEMKNIMAGSGIGAGSGDCPVGTTVLYAGPDGCGTAHYSFAANGYCTVHVTITEQQPCGWA